MLAQISNVISSQIDRLSVEQMKLLEISKEHQADWEKIYTEVVAEYQQKGYYLEKPKVQPYDAFYEEDQTFLRIELSPTVEKIIGLTFDSKLPVNHEKHRNSEIVKADLLGLSPKTKDDDEFVVIDQVGDHLTAEQQKEYDRKQAEAASLAQAKQDFEAAEAVLLAEKEKEVAVEMERVTREQEILNRKLAEENRILEEKLKLEEREALGIVGKRAQMSSEITDTFKKEVLHFAQSVVTEKHARLVNKELVFSKSDKSGYEQTPTFSEKDYFLKPQGISLDETSGVLDLKPFDDTDMTDNKLFLEAIIEPSSEEKTSFEATEAETGEEAPTDAAALEIGLPGNEELYSQTDNEELNQLIEGEVVDAAPAETDELPAAAADADETDAKTEVVERVVEKVVYKSPNIDLGLIKKRIMHLDDEISALSRYAERNEKKVEQAVRLRDELKQQFDQQMEVARIEFTEDQEKINAYLKQEVKPLETNGDEFISDAIETHELNFHPQTDELKEPDLDPTIAPVDAPTFFEKTDEVKPGDAFGADAAAFQPDAVLTEPVAEPIPADAANFDELSDFGGAEPTDATEPAPAAGAVDDGFEPYVYDDDGHDFPADTKPTDEISASQFDQWTPETPADAEQPVQPTTADVTPETGHEPAGGGDEGSHELSESDVEPQPEPVEEPKPKKGLFGRLKSLWGKK